MRIDELLENRDEELADWQASKSLKKYGGKLPDWS
jgi:hypothetical protein